MLDWLAGLILHGGAIGLASTYGDGDGFVAGMPTFSGEPFDPQAMAGALDARVVKAAPRALMQTWVAVCLHHPDRPATNAECVGVWINDTGAFSGPEFEAGGQPRVIDLTPAAARAVGGGGLIPVTVTLPAPPIIPHPATKPRRLRQARAAWVDGP